MNRRSRWSHVLVIYTALLWAATLGSAALAATIPNNWTGTEHSLPLNIVLLNALGILGPALATAAFTLLAVTVTLRLHRSRQTPSASTQEAEDDWLDAT